MKRRLTLKILSTKRITGSLMPAQSLSPAAYLSSNSMRLLRHASLSISIAIFHNCLLG
ncbi:MAG: hypothetical protein KME19_08220 [Microcoleus vaginatus WJT46-NPBG5]|nr:hypothetical protein [Microcoleus vaginatus WJT46-NPBG5]